MTDPPSPERPSRWRRFVVLPARAGALAGGGSAMGLALALAIDSARGRTVPMAVWVASTTAACTAAVLVGYPRAPLTPDRVLRRALGVGVYGLVLGGAPMALITAQLSRPRQDAASILVLVVLSFALVAFGLRDRSRRPLEVDVDDAPGGLLPAALPEDHHAGSTYALARSGPALGAEETERDDLAVEVRVLWGADLLRVEHLCPPRRYLVGDGGDLVIDVEALGASALPLVVVDDSEPSVIAPRAATGVIERDAARVTLDHAIEQGLAEPFDGAPSALRVPLSLGARVTMSLPLGAPATPYRAALAGPDAAEARVVIEIAMVRAGRVIGREISLEGAGRFALSAAIALSVAAVLPLGKARQPTCFGTCDEPTEDALVYMAQSIEAMGERPEIEELPPGMAEARRFDGALDPASPFDLPSEAALFGPALLCLPLVARLDDPEVESFPSAIHRFCDAPALSPFGLRALGTPPNVDLLGRDPTDAWSPLFVRALRAAPPQGHAPPTRVRSLVVRSDPLEASAIERALHERQGALRDCVALAQRHDPAPHGAIDLRATLDPRGLLGDVSILRVRRVESPRTTPGGVPFAEEGAAGARIAAPCVRAALGGVHVSRATRAVESVVVSVEIRPASR